MTTINARKTEDGSIRYATTGREVGSDPVVYYCGRESVDDRTACDRGYGDAAIRHLQTVMACRDLVGMRAWLAGVPSGCVADAAHFAARFTRQSLIAAGEAGSDVCSVAVLIVDGVIGVSGIESQQPAAYSMAAWFAMLDEVA
jgi:hypothetical protein